MKLLDAAREAVFCAISITQPVGCLPGDHPAVQLLPLPCISNDVAVVDNDWFRGVWGDDEICWRPTKKGDVVIAAPNQTPKLIALRKDQQVCSLVRCNPTQSVQTGAFPGSKK